MNITAYMAACDVWDLDRDAKDALRTVCGRMDYESGVAVVPVGRVAADMKVCREIAHRALERVVAAEYLSVDKPPGGVPRWRANPAMLYRGVPRDDPATQRRGGVATQDRGLRIFGREGSAAAPPSPGGGAVENPAHPGSCRCQGTGWVETGQPDGVVTRCTVTPSTETG